jgi:hypothetical protein
VIASSGSSEVHSDDVASPPGEPRINFLERRAVLYPAFGAAILLGFALRAIQYAADRSLWFDESMLVLNIMHRSAAGLTRTLDYSQAAPLGFLELEKLATHALGDSELALRVLPFVFGLASVLLFAVLALRLLSPASALLAAFVFACAANPVYYASEVKQYSGDVAVAICLTLLGVVLLGDGVSRRTQVVAAFGGASTMLLSHASVFVAGGIALALAVRALVQRDRRAFEAFAATVSWLVVGIFIVLFTRARTGQLDTVIGAGQRSFGHGASIESRFRWARDVSSSLLRSIGYPDDAPERYLHWPLLALAVVGAVGLARRRPACAAMLLLPFVITWVASALNEYPIFDRTVLFLVPATVLLLCEGAAVLVRAAPPRALRVCVGGIFVAAVLLGPLVHASARTVDPVQHEEMKEALGYVRSHWRPGDALFVDREARFAFRYYLDCDCLRATEVGGRGLAWRFGEGLGQQGRGPVPLRSVDPRFVVGRLDVGPRAFRNQLRSLDGRPRVWIVYTHLSSASERLQIAATLQRLDRLGRRLASFGAVGAHAYLYDLRPRPS